MHEIINSKDYLNKERLGWVYHVLPKKYESFFTRNLEVDKDQEYKMRFLLLFSLYKAWIGREAMQSCLWRGYGSCWRLWGGGLTCNCVATVREARDHHQEER